MRSDRRTWLALALVIVSALDVRVYAAGSGAGQVDTFQPGKRYRCVPTSDRSGWDCKESGKASDSVAQATASAADTQIAPATVASAAEVSAQPTAAAPTPRPAPAPTQSAAPAPHASELPAYLTNAAAQGTAPRTQPAPSTAPASAAKAQPPRAAGGAKADTTRSPEAARGSPPAPAPTSTTSSASPPSATRASSASGNHVQGTSLGNREFLALPGERFVLELGRGDSPAAYAAQRDALHVPQGDVYELHLHREGGDWWLLVWASFEDLQTARAARGELLPQVAAGAGWPRRIAPLQAEVRRAGE